MITPLLNIVTAISWEIRDEEDQTAAAEHHENMHNPEMNGHTKIHCLLMKQVEIVVCHFY